MLKHTFFMALLGLLIASNSSFAQNERISVMDEEDLNFNLKEDAFGNKLNQKEEISVDPSRSLSQNLKRTEKYEVEPKEIKEKKGTAQSWIKKFFESDRKNDSIQKLLDENKAKAKARRSNAAVFDVAGVMLQMSYEQAEEQLLKRGYRKTSQKMDVPNFIRWRNEEKCRNQGVVGYERLENCIIMLAKKDHYQFVSQAIFNKYDTKETVQVFFSSTFTNNKVYKVTYRTEAADLKGNSAKAVYLRNIKVFDFWKKISQKYGDPDNKEDVTWGLGLNKPYLQATTGFLKLEDPVLKELDVERMAREDQRFIHSDIYTF